MLSFRHSPGERALLLLQLETLLESGSKGDMLTPYLFIFITILLFSFLLPLCSLLSGIIIVRSSWNVFFLFLSLPSLLIFWSSWNVFFFLLLLPSLLIFWSSWNVFFFLLFLPSLLIFWSSWNVLFFLCFIWLRLFYLVRLWILFTFVNLP